MTWDLDAQSTLFIDDIYAVPHGTSADCLKKTAPCGVVPQRTPSFPIEIVFNLSGRGFRRRLHPRPDRSLKKARFTFFCTAMGSTVLFCEVMGSVVISAIV